MEIIKKSKFQIEIGLCCGYLDIFIAIKNIDIDIMFIGYRCKYWRIKPSDNWKQRYKNPVFSKCDYKDGRKGYMFFWFNIVYEMVKDERSKYYSSKHQKKLLDLAYNRKENIYEQIRNIIDSR